MTEFACATPALAALATKCRQLAVERGKLFADPVGFYVHYAYETPRLMIQYRQNHYMVVYVGHVKIADFNVSRRLGSSCRVDAETAWLMVDMAAYGIELLTSIARV